MKIRLKTVGKTALFFSLPLLVFAWTSLPGPANYTLHIALIAILVAVGMTFVKKSYLQLPKIIIQALLVLFLVGGTGWFLSPFFFLLYLLPIYLGFLYTPAVAFGFLAALLTIFAFSVGEVEVAFDIMTLLSLLLVIPLVIYLRKQFLILRQTEKDILILQDDKSGIQDVGTISHLLSNRVTKLGVTLRDPLTFLRQASTALQETPGMPEQSKSLLERMRTTAAKALEQIKSFETDTSAHRVLSNTENEKTIVKPGEKKEYHQK